MSDDKIIALTFISIGFLAFILMFVGLHFQDKIESWGKCRNDKQPRNDKEPPPKGRLSS